MFFASFLKLKLLDVFTTLIGLACFKSSFLAARCIRLKSPFRLVCSTLFKSRNTAFSARFKSFARFEGSVRFAPLLLAYESGSRTFKPLFKPAALLAVSASVCGDASAAFRARASAILFSERRNI